ncbi:hypothetical protein BDW59DRAFT_124417 [Aspergillus cavernicola]|uniref:Transmembrane protein n=1 Tax=Aspergillus cavernicola TaxID=176166 RepID=A0ABR4IVD9_9EURO
MKKQHGIHWRMPTAMISCFLIGLGLAIGHHFHYYSLDGTRVGNQSKQEWALRIGTGLAFLTKTFLTTAVGIACIQNFWWIIRLKPVRLSTLDSMFDIRGSIFNFFDLHIWLRGPNVAVLGLISWLIPLVTVITPSTLSVESSVQGTISERPIPIMDYEFNKYTTRTQGGLGGATQSLDRQLLNSVIHGSILNVPAPAPNASYTLDFFGPHIQCQNASDYVNNTVNQYLLDKNRLRTNYVAFVSSANLTADLDSLLYGDSTTWYWHDVNATDYAAKLIIAAYDQAPVRSVVECAMYNASYTVDFDFNLGEQNVQIVNRTVLNRVLPVTELFEPPVPANQNELFGYTAIMTALNEILVGTCFTWPENCVETQIFSTSLANSKELWPMVYGSDVPAPTDLPPLAQVAAQMGENITLSFFGNSYFLQNSSQSQPINVTFYENDTYYLYSQKNLLIAYGVAVFVSLLCVMAGLLTMWDNGVAFTDSFSTILRATRNKKFDEIVPEDSTTGSDPPPEALSKTQVQWVPANDRDDTVAGLKPLSGIAEPEKPETRSPVSPISFSNRIWERKTYQPAVSRADTSPDGFI